MKHAWVAPAVAELHQELRGNMQHYDQEMERHRQFSAAVLQEQALMNSIMVPKRALSVTTASGTAPECENIPQQCRMDASHAKVQESLQMEQQQEPQQDAAPSMHKQLPIEAYNAADLKKMKLLQFAACSATAALNRRLNIRVKILADQLKTADAIHESRGLRMKNMQQEIAALGQELVEAKQTLLWQQQREEYKAHNARLAALKAQHKAEIQQMSVALAEIKAAKQAKIEVFSVDLADASTGKQTALLQMQAAQESGAATVELHEARQDVQLHGQQASVGKETYNAKLGALTVQTQAQDVQPCGELAAPNAAKELALSWYQLQAKQQQVEAIAQQLGETRLQQQQCQQLDAEHKGSDCHDVTSDADPALVADSAAANGEHVSFNRPVNLNAASSSTNSSCSVAEPDTPAAAQPEQPLEEEQVQQSQASTEDSDSDAGICGSKISSLQNSSNRSTSQHNQAEVTARLATNDVRKTHNNILVRTACRLLSRFRGKQLNKPVHNISSTSAVINVLNLSEEEEQQQQQPQAASDQHVSTALIIIDNDAGVVDDCNNSLLDSSLIQSSPALSSLPVSDTGNDDNAGDDCIRPSTADSINSSNSLCDDQTLAVMNSKINGNLLKRAAHRLLGLVKRKQLHHSGKAVKNAILAASNNPLAALGTGSDATIERLQLPVVLSSMATSGSVNKRTGPCGGLHYHMKLRMMRASSKRRHLAGAAVELHLSNHW